MARIRRAARAAGLGLAALLLAGCTPDARRAHTAGEPAFVVIADFVSATSDPIFEPSLKQALAIALEPSTIVRIFGGAHVADSLRGMNRSADERLTADLAWEIAVREEIDLLVLGTIDASLDGYVITREAVQSDGGATLARATARAANRAGTIDALGRAALDLRRSLGEPAASVAQSDRPLTQVTTASLDALAAYAAGREHSDRGRHALAEPPYCHALAIDPGFTLARAALRTPDSCRDVLPPPAP